MSRQRYPEEFKTEAVKQSPAEMPGFSLVRQEWRVARKRNQPGCGGHTGGFGGILVCGILCSVVSVALSKNSIAVLLETVSVLFRLQ